ncbi:MAG: leucine-rich repeat protein [Eubacteriaceae bacterium]|nr:leucine-rich repeat protein [Eubacteriaceae bacterium]
MNRKEFFRFNTTLEGPAKKRGIKTLTGLLALFFALSLMPAFVQAAAPTAVYVGSVNVTTGFSTPKELYGGLVTYSQGVLTLNGVSVPNTDYYEKSAVYTDGDITLTLEGENTVTGPGPQYVEEQSRGINVNGNLTINGEGSLNATSGDANDKHHFEGYGIYCYGDLTVNGGSIKGIGGGTNVTSSYGVYCGGGLFVNKGDLTAQSIQSSLYCYGVRCYGGITVTGGTLTAITGGGGADKSFAVRCSGDLSVSSGSLTAEARWSGTDTVGLACNALKLSGGYLTVTGYGSSASGIGIRANGNIVLTGGCAIIRDDTSAMNKQPSFSDSSQSNDEWYMWKASTAQAPEGDFTYAGNSSTSSYSYNNSHRYIEIRNAVTVGQGFTALSPEGVGVEYTVLTLPEGAEPGTVQVKNYSRDVWDRPPAVDSATSELTLTQSVTKAETGENFILTAIGDYAFYSCANLTLKNGLPEGIKTIGENAFFNCTSLVLTRMPGELTQIGRFSFQNCDALKDLTFSNKLTAIDRAVFQGCSSLESLTFTSLDPPALTDTSFYACPALTSVYIPYGAEGYLTAEYMPENAVLKNKINFTGKVTDAETASSVKGANVSLSIDGGETVSGATDDDGQYSLIYDMPAAGGRNYSLTAVKAGYLPADETSAVNAANMIQNVELTAEASPTITGVTELTLADGYDATSTGVFTATGAPLPTLTKTEGASLITYNDTTGKLDIAQGLAPGGYIRWC